MNIREKLLHRIDLISPLIIEVSNYIHENPESGYKEFRAVEYLTSMLNENSFRVEKPLKDIPTAFCASYTGKRKKPSVGFIAEYDALPEIGHGCGHNLIAASGFGCAVALAPILDEIGGTVYLFGTPAEEYDGGKIPMLSSGVFDKADAIIMMHPECIYLVNTRSLAMDSIQFEFNGKASHASATPHDGINALDAVILLFNSINALRQQLKPDVRIHGIITKGGSYPNIIPDHTEAKFYLRSQEREYLDEVTKKVKNCALGAAKATGCKLKLSNFERSFDNLINNSILSSLLEKNLRSLDVKDIETIDNEPGSTDFGNVSHKIPAVYMYAATAPKGNSLHTRNFAKLSSTSYAHKNMIISIKAMALTALEIFSHPEMITEIKKELELKFNQN